MEGFAGIDRLFYINLDARADRKREIEAEFARIGVPKEKIERFAAIKHEKGAIGCGESHIAILTVAEQRGYEVIAIVEDDFNFIANAALVHERLAALKSLPKWSVCLLAAVLKRVAPKSPLFDNVLEAQTTAGYVVHRAYFSTLRRCFEEAVKKLKAGEADHIYAVDQYWKRLQERDGWLVFRPKLGYQRRSFSDLCGRVTDNSPEERETDPHLHALATRAAGTNVILATTSGNGAMVEDRDRGQGVVFLINSTISPDFRKPLSYTPVRSMYSVETRLQQTIYTVRSIRQHLPLARILVCDNSRALPDGAIDTLVKTGAHSVVRCFHEVTSDSPHKGLGEATSLLAGLKSLRESKYDWWLLFKISGRYWLTHRFSLNRFTKHGDRIVGLTDNGIMQTALFSVPRSLETQYKNCMETINARGAADAFEGQVTGHLRSHIQHTDIIGVAGHVSVDGALYDR